jgi:WD40 repeat protein/serine/threonine protein kinase
VTGLIRRQLGQYTIIATLGRGGMATVYRAQQASIRREVAIKVIETKLTDDPQFIKRFKREAQTVAALDHPHILKVFDFGSQDDLLYLVMELKTGGSLAARLKANGKLNAEEVARYLDQIGAALDHAHNRGVIHRDLKPQNVLLDQDNNAILGDFGIARIMGEVTGLTDSDMRLGTPRYMAPEQWNGNDADARTDIYALAVMTYELLTGKLPFTGNTPYALMYQHLNNPPPSIRLLRPDLPQSVEKVLLKGMAKRPEHRFQRASEFASAFREALSGKTPKGVDVAATQPPIPVSIPKPQPPKPRSARGSLIGLSLLAILVWIAALAALLGSQSSAAELFDRTPTALSIQVADAPTETPTLTATPALTPETLTLTATPTPPVRNAAENFDQMVTLRTLTGHQNSVRSVVWSPDGRFIASGSQDHTIRVWDAASGQLLRTLEKHSHWVRSVAWSPDGRFLASGSDDNTVRIWDAANGQLLRTLTGHESWINHVKWSPDGRYVISASHDGTLRIWEVSTGEVIRTMYHTPAASSVAWSHDGSYIVSGSDGALRLRHAGTGKLLHRLIGHTGWVGDVMWSPDDRYIVSASADNTVRMWDAATGAMLRVLSGHTEYVNTTVWSPDGRYVVSGGWDDVIIIWLARTGERLATLTGHKDGVWSVAWSSDGRFLASGSADGTIRIWGLNRTASAVTPTRTSTPVAGAAVPVRMIELRTLTGHEKRVQSVAWSPDGRFLASGADDNTVRVWDVETGQLLQTLTGKATVAWSPDGRYLAAGSDDNTVRVWDAANGQLLQTLTGHTSWINRVKWSPDGRRVITASSDGTVRIWEASTGKVTHTLDHRPAASSVAWSHDGKYIASGSNGTIRLRDAKTGQLLRTLSGHTSWVGDVMWSPDDRYIVSGAADNTVRLWDAATGEMLRVLSGHTRYVNNTAWSPDGRYIASGGSDDIIIIWSTQTGERLATLSGHEDVVWSVAWSPDGRYLASAGSDGTVRIWGIR